MRRVTALTFGRPLSQQDRCLSEGMHDSLLCRPKQKICFIYYKWQKNWAKTIFLTLCCSGYLTFCGRGEKCIRNRRAFHSALCEAEQSLNSTRPRVKPSQCELNMLEREWRQPSDLGFSQGNGGCNSRGQCWKKSLPIPYISWCITLQCSTSYNALFPEISDFKQKQIQSC